MKSAPATNPADGMINKRGNRAAVMIVAFAAGNS